MIVINTVDSTRFTYNGIPYFKNFTPIVRGGKVEVINTYDSRLRLTDFATDYDQFSVNGTVYASVDLLQQALLPILFTRANLGGGAGVQSVTGDIVDNTDPLNPVVDLPTIDESKWEIVDAGILNNVGVGDLRVPTDTELDNERLSWGANNPAGAFGSPLKLTMAGFRNGVDGSLNGVGTEGYYLTRTLATLARFLYFSNGGGAFMFDSTLATGISVRLILNGTFTQQQFNDNYSGETIVIEGITYGYVYNATTSRIWLDRNLGATQVATSSTDADAYGWLYQWGRLTDGHQIRTSGTTATLSSTDVPGHGDFILAPNSPFDWRSPQNNNLWQVGQKLIGKDSLKADYEDLLNKPDLGLTTGYTVATLPIGITGQTAYVTDATTVTYRGTATGGGVNIALVMFDGTNWIYH